MPAAAHPALAAYARRLESELGRDNCTVLEELLIGQAIGAGVWLKLLWAEPREAVLTSALERREPRKIRASIVRHYRN